MSVIRRMEDVSINVLTHPAVTGVRNAQQAGLARDASQVSQTS